MSEKRGMLPFSGKHALSLLMGLDGVGGEPVFVLRIVAVHDLEEFLLEVLRHRAGMAGTDGAAVHGADGREFGGVPQKKASSAT